MKYSSPFISQPSKKYRGYYNSKLKVAWVDYPVLSLIIQSPQYMTS
jgi:hypothetical protein